MSIAVWRRSLEGRSGESHSVYVSMEVRHIVDKLLGRKVTLEEKQT